MLKSLKNFIKGMSSIFCLDPRSSPLNQKKKLYNPAKSDKEVLQEDWKKVGQDLWKVIGKIDKEIKK